MSRYMPRLSQVTPGRIKTRPMLSVTCLHVSICRPIRRRVSESEWHSEKLRLSPRFVSFYSITESFLIHSAV